MDDLRVTVHAQAGEIGQTLAEARSPRADLDNSRGITGGSGHCDGETRTSEAASETSLQGGATGRALEDSRKWLAGGDKSPQGGREAKCLERTEPSLPNAKDPSSEGRAEPRQESTPSKLSSARKSAASEAGGGQAGNVDRSQQAPSQEPAGDGGVDAPNEGRQPARNSASTEIPDHRWDDPIVQELVHLTRMRRRILKMRNGLILQGKSYGRALCEGDKVKGAKMFDRIMEGDVREGDEALAAIIEVFGGGIAQADTKIKSIERDMEKLAKRLPIADFVSQTTGLGWKSAACIVGEAGDLSKYPSVAGVWKRLGLAVIDGDGRQRKCADAEKAAIHGYNPTRRSEVWQMADSMSRLVRTWTDKETGEVKKAATAPYGTYLEEEKLRQLAKGERPIVAETRAKRHMSKRVIRDMVLAWRRATVQLNIDTQIPEGRGPFDYQEAAE